MSQVSAFFENKNWKIPIETKFLEFDATALVLNYAKDNWNEDVVKFLKTSKNEGLIRAKMFGAAKASGEILLFLDSHCEVNEGWLEPLLDRIHEKRTRYVAFIVRWLIEFVGVPSVASSIPTKSEKNRFQPFLCNFRFYTLKRSFWIV